jgi:alginate O-acetyltransferase complex protein AlgJ
MYLVSKDMIISRKPQTISIWIFIATLVFLFVFPAIVLYGKLIYIKLGLPGHDKLFRSYLLGVSEKVDLPNPTIGGFISGKYQEQFSKWFGQNIALRTFFIKTCNQLYYSLFEATYMDSKNIVVGKEKQLYQMVYVDEYCGRSPHLSDDVMEEMAARIAEIQKLLAGKGVRFMVLITPSKAYTYPEYIPGRFRCQPDRHVQGYERGLEVFAKHGVQVLDCQRLMLEEKARSSLPLFPQGGIHWNQYAVYLSVNALAQYLEGLLGARLPRLDCLSISMVSPKGVGMDMDLAALLNLHWPPIHYQTLKLDMARNADSQSVQPRVAVVGGSFNWDLLAMLHNYQVFGPIDFYFYYMLELVTYPRDQLRQENFNPEAIDWDREFLNKDLIILEVNEHAVFRAVHVNWFVTDALYYLRRAAPKEP